MKIFLLTILLIIICILANYVKNQGDEYRKLYRSNEIEGQMNLYDYE